MGTSFVHKSKDITVKDFLIKELSENSEKSIFKVLACSVKGNTAYLAIEYTKKETNEKKVYADIVLLYHDNKDYCNFGYKIISEDMGAFQCEAPQKILSLLTPTNSAYALEWRKKCKDNIGKAKATRKIKVDVGQIIRFDDPIDNFKPPVQEVQLVPYRKRIILKNKKGLYYRIVGWRKLNFKIIPNFS